VRMGLLDDAIREHLELKRRRGADPGEVAREQREALEPIVLDGDRREASDAAAADELAPDHAQAESAGASADVASAPGEYAEAAQPAEATDPAYGGETAELEMRSVLGEEAEAPAGADPSPGDSPDDQPPAAAAAAAAATAPADGDSLEWEMPSEARGEEHTTEEPDEDVLEETPDFLRDTPEQERLWFEQRPPRDFDFDK
jgi:hypothetical protein